MSPVRMVISLGSTSRVSAAIWVRAVSEPWPISWPLVIRKKVPSSFIRMMAAEPALVGMEGDFQPAAMPLPRTFRGLGLSLFSP